MYYKQILISSGEVPEKEGYYIIESLDGKSVERVYFNDRGLNSYTKLPIDNYYWLKPIEEPTVSKREMIDFMEWLRKNTKDYYMGQYFYSDMVNKTYIRLTPEQVYNKYEEEHGAEYKK